MEEIKDLGRVMKALIRSRARSANRYSTIIPKSESDQVFNNLNAFAATRCVNEKSLQTESTKI